jgi:hypothetical protein
MKDEQDRWQALADELGLPAEPTKQPAPMTAPPPVAERVVEKTAPQPAPAEPAPKPAPWERPPVDRPAQAELAESVEETVSLPPITSLDPPHLDPMLEGPPLDRLPDMGGFSDEQADSDRPRGRGGRRGQRGGGRRGQRGDRPEPAAAPMPSGPEAAEPVGEGPVDDSPREDRSRRRGGGGGSGRGRRPPERRPEPEPEEVLGEDEPVETMAMEEDIDDGPEDNLADLNVPSWADLIASLYRPER